MTEELLRPLLETEEQLFERAHPASFEAFGRASKSMIGGVPMPWMTQWASPYPVFVAEAAGSRFIDIDDNAYCDFCYGDTGAMAGHSPAPVVAAVVEQVRLGITTMLPTSDAAEVAEELARRFGLAYWQFALTATDANRFAIRLARRLTGRRKVVVFNWSYHGSVDETLAVLVDGEVQPRPQSIGPPVSPDLTTKVVEWNDADGLEAALAAHDVACVLAEPVMTNIGIVHPEDGFHEAMRDLTRAAGTLLIIDETHTLCAGPGGCTSALGLEPDMVTIGKAIAGGVPAAAYGVSAEVVGRFDSLAFLRGSDVGGIGGTLAGNALSIAAIRATLRDVLTDEAFERMFRLAERFAEGVDKTIREFRLPWHVTRLGCRAEYWFCPDPPRSGGEAAEAVNPALDRFIHLYLLNRGILMTPFHNMALMSPATAEADVDQHSMIFREAVETLAAAGALDRGRAQQPTQRV